MGLCLYILGSAYLSGPFLIKLIREMWSKVSIFIVLEESHYKGHLNDGWKKDPLLFLGPTFSRYYNAIVGHMMTFSVRSSKIQDLQHWGHTICSKKKLDRHIAQKTSVGFLPFQLPEKLFPISLGAHIFFWSVLQSTSIIIVLNDSLLYGNKNVIYQYKASG